MDQDVIDQIATKSYKCGFRGLQPNDLFHTQSLSADIVTRLYRAGFREVNAEVDAYTHAGHTPSTPLWKHSEDLLGLIPWIFRNRFMENLKYLHWLVVNGAKLERLHPKVGTAPAHLISASLSQYLFARNLRHDI